MQTTHSEFSKRGTAKCNSAKETERKKDREMKSNRKEITAYLARATDTSLVVQLKDSNLHVLSGEDCRRRLEVAAITRIPLLEAFYAVAESIVCMCRRPRVQTHTSTLSKPLLDCCRRTVTAGSCHCRHCSPSRRPSCHCRICMCDLSQVSLLRGQASVFLAPAESLKRDWPTYTSVLPLKTLQN